MRHNSGAVEQLHERFPGKAKMMSKPRQFAFNFRVKIHNTKVFYFASERLIWRFEQFQKRL